MSQFASKKLLALILFFSIGIATSGCFEGLGGGYTVEGGSSVKYTYPMGRYGSRTSREVFGADPKSFEEIDRYYGRDRNSTFYAGKLIKGSDGPTFERIEFPYARDRSWWTGGTEMGNIILDA